jgi:hypothetical protein
MREFLKHWGIFSNISFLKKWERGDTPVIFADSKGNCIQNHVGRSHPVEREIIFWCKGGAKIKDRFNWLFKSVLQQKVAELGAIWIRYMWLLFIQQEIHLDQLIQWRKNYRSIILLQQNHQFSPTIWEL